MREKKRERKRERERERERGGVEGWKQVQRFNKMSLELRKEKVREKSDMR